MIKIHSGVLPLLFFALSTAFAANPEDLYTIEGTDFTLEELLASGAIVPGVSFGEGPVLGSLVVVNHELLEQLTGKLGPIWQNIGIQHQAGHGSRSTFYKWTRWYQEDRNTQILRLFKGDQNFRAGIGENTTPGRIEAYSNGVVVEPGTWFEWEATYTIIKPHGAVIFQMFHEGGQLWAFHLNMSSTGGISFNRRRDIAGLPKNITIGENMAGKPLSIKVRSNGFEYVLYSKRPLEDDDWNLVTTGYYQKAQNNKIQFRWGMYLGQEKGASVKNDALLFVTGATIRKLIPQLPQLFVNTDAYAGTVIRNPDKVYYEEGEEVVVTAEAKPGFRFKNWTGDYAGEENPLTINMDSTINITANFVAEFIVTISENTVNGTVAISPDKPHYDYGETISCTPHPASGYRFGSWYAEGGIGGSSVPLQITINRNIELTAYFNLITYQLIASARNGTIARNPHRAVYASGTQVELTATPNEGYQFTGWSGYISGEENPITITMDSTIYITANFDKASSIEYTGDVLFKVYPNPSKGDLTLEVGKSVTYSVYNLSGVRLKEGEGFGTLYLDLNGYPRGMYLLEIRTQEGVGYKRLLLD